MRGVENVPYEGGPKPLFGRGVIREVFHPPLFSTPPWRPLTSDFWGLRWASQSQIAKNRCDFGAPSSLRREKLLAKCPSLGNASLFTKFLFVLRRKLPLLPLHLDKLGHPMDMGGSSRLASFHEEKEASPKLSMVAELASFSTACMQLSI